MTTVEQFSLITDALQKSVNTWLSLSLWDKIDSLPDFLGPLDTRNTFVPLPYTDATMVTAMNAMQKGWPILERSIKKDAPLPLENPGAQSQVVKDWITKIHGVVISARADNQLTVESLQETWAGSKVAPFVIGMGAIRQCLSAPTSDGASTKDSREWHNSVLRSIEESTFIPAWKATAPVIAKLPSQSEIPVEVGIVLDVLTIFIGSLSKDHTQQPESTELLSKALESFKDGDKTKAFPMSDIATRIKLSIAAEYERRWMSESLETK